jgi:hypothetical protein
MPIKPPLTPTDRDLARARQILGSWISSDRLSSDEGEVIARMIAQGIGEGRRQGLELAEGECAAGHKNHLMEVREGLGAKSQ